MAASRRFTTPDSFRLFMEGLRSIQLYEDEASKDNPPPQSAKLDQCLADAFNSLDECVRLYPRDLLPRYYLGTALALQAQAEAARQLRRDVTVVPPLSRPSPAARADELYREAAKYFGQTADLAGRGDIETYAIYNQAQTLAKIDDAGAQNQALSLLGQINADRYTWRTLPLKQRVTERMLAVFRNESRSMSALLDHVGGRLDGTPGMTASAIVAVGERAALVIQTRLLANTLRILKSARIKPTLEYDPEKDRTFRAVPIKARNEIAADACNKRAYVFWKRWVESGVPSAANAPQLIAALACIAQAKTLVKRTSWTPAQLNEARVAMAQGDFGHALGVLACILGVDTPPPRPAPAPDDPAAIATRVVAMITKNATFHDAAAIVAIVRANYGPLPREVVRLVTDALPDTIDPPFLANILSAI